ncbi:glycoside hydrolase family 3 C-terminal domain-containing protein [Duganella sp. Root198D2]|uniref:glycoside hydrolase family 3 C-terminal domain-containing protein n=1 Tax=Duganella sp. Root198D2 TaxID=1736489 RepID=UPI000708BA11|nr:glycoside hydrolase family 3 C-terminal domain-containing protein [Duganella sp. Root198D2]KRB92409.1 glucan 1,4-alpha-glucosidase [Duganella sp. Root198D2]
MNIDRRSVCAKAAAIVIGMYALSAQAYSGGSAADLVAQMTLEEKASLLQHDSPAIARLGIPAYNWWNEGLHGVARAGNATVFPQAIGLAATWNSALMKRVGDTVATEFRAKYLETVGADGATGIYRGLTVWSPNVNIFRDPRWGRGQETYGEDPYLTSLMGVAYIQGLQGDDPLAPKVSATVKHLAVHSGPESDRHRDDVHPAPRDLVETYLPAFHATVTQGKALSVMCAYNAVDGVPACANVPLLKDFLRGAWKFRGHIVSDCGAVADIHLDGAHRYAKTPEEAVAAAVNAGTDLVCEFGGSPTAAPATTVRAVKQGLLAEAALDRAIQRLLEARIRLGLLETPGNRPYRQISAKDYDTPAHRSLNLETARQSLVLLKNDGLLPLKKAPRHIAVIGPNAHSIDALVGNYSGTPSRPVTVLDGIRARFPNAQVSYVEGTGWVAPPLQDLPPGNLYSDAACTQAGLKLERFDNTRLQGTPSASETMAQAQFKWGWPDAYERQTSARWSGYVRAAESGMHNFRLKGGQPYRIRVDGQLVADLWDIAWPTAKTEIRLQAGKVYRIEIEAQQTGWSGEQRLQWSKPSFDDTAALEAASKADLIVYVSGLNWELEGEEMSVQAPGFAGGDRTSIDLPAPQEALLERLAALGRPMVLVNMSGSAMALNWAEGNVPAIIQAWYPGGEGGQAVAELIAGDFSPSGRLPVTFYKAAADLPPFKDYSMQGRTYKYLKGAPLYPFGHGLSYTHFSYSASAATPKTVCAGCGIKLSVDVKNDGKYAGDEVVQVYVSRPGGSAPTSTLTAFTRVHLEPGERRRIAFALDGKAMSTVDAKGNRIVEAGSAIIWVGGGQPAGATVPHPSSGVRQQLTVKGRRQLPQF